MRKRWIGPALVIETPAKLNLHLSVLARRQDGYHELETVMASIGLYDSLTFQPASSGLQLHCSGLNGSLTGDDSNLVLRAARLLVAETGCQQGVQIHLHKRIPMQAGMGGGSSDAAATLVGLNDVWRLGLPSSRLHDFAAQLGSDVNFFIDSAPLAVCRGRGEVVEPRPLKAPLWFVVAKPESGLSTAAVFRQLKLTNCGKREPRAVLQACECGDSGAIASQLMNDLEQPSRELSPELSDLLQRFERSAVAGSRMTGSGSACYALAFDREQAMRTARRLRQGGVNEVYVVRTAV